MIFADLVVVRSTFDVIVVISFEKVFLKILWVVVVQETLCIVLKKEMGVEPRNFLWSLQRGDWRLPEIDDGSKHLSGTTSMFTCFKTSKGH